MNNKEKAWSANMIACCVAGFLLAISIDIGIVPQNDSIMAGIAALLIMCFISFSVYFLSHN